MERIAVDAVLLRGQYPELSLRPGASLVARVASRGEGHGVLVLAGLPLTAKLPDEVDAGETLRLTVSEVTSERIILRLDPPPAPPAPPSPPSAGRVAVEEAPRRGATPGPEGASVALSFQSEALGRLDLEVEVGPGAVRVGVTAPRGKAFESAGRHADELRVALEQGLTAHARVDIRERREPLDLYA